MGGRLGVLGLALACLTGWGDPGGSADISLGRFGPLPLCHPERSEGSCTPRSITGEEIPRSARDDRRGSDRDDTRGAAREVSRSRRLPDTTHWTRLARDLHAETNLVRRDPPAYARHLEDMLPRFEGRVLERPGRPHLRTDEGPAAVREAIATLKLRPAAPALRWSPGLAAGAADHVRDQGPRGGFEHRGTDNSDPARRASRYGRWISGVAENIAYGENPARDVVIQLLVDDGVADRGHRDNLLNPGWRVVGIACGPHSIFRQMCVMNYAVEYVER